MAVPAAQPSAWSGGRTVSRTELLWGFLRIGLSAFGGVAPVARFEMVERRGWLTDAEYATLLGVGCILPGANTINLAVMMGDRFQGVSGALIAVTALMAAPVAMAVGLLSLYARFAADPLVRAVMTGAAAATAGMVLGMGLKMAKAIRPAVAPALFGAATLAAVGFAGFSLIPVVLVLAPLAVVVVALERRR